MLWGYRFACALDDSFEKVKAPVLAGLAGAAIALFAANTARAATVAGETPGALAVNQGGQATYTVPLAVPPGIAGMEPALSLVYSSGGQNGVLGVGWSISGLSRIHRCPRTVAQDGVIDGVQYDAGDRFCLDGQRLVAVSGVYGADGTEYRTEIDSFVKVVSFGVAGAGPAWFRAWTKSGQVMDYGNTADSRVEAVGRADVHVWAASKIADSVGNYLTLSYIEEITNGQHRIERIDYAFNDAAAVTAKSSVQFFYSAGNRPDLLKGYIGGSQVFLYKRLESIQTFTDGALVRDYRLGYETGAATGRSRLTSITACDSLGDCLAPQIFDWKPKQGGFAYSPGLNLPDIIYDYLDPGGAIRGQLVDVNGDGRSDWVRAYKSDGGNFFQASWLSTGTGWQAGPTPPFIIHDFSGTYAGNRRGDFVDLNGDGVLDFIQSVVLGSSSLRNAWVNTGNGWQVSGQTPPFHMSRYTTIDHSNPSCRGDNCEYEPPSYPNIREGDFADVNADGLVDWVRAFRDLNGAVGQTTWGNTPTGWNEYSALRPPFLIYNYQHSNYYRTAGYREGDFVDVNGDGRPDWVQSVQVTLRKTGSGAGETSSVLRNTWINTGTGWSLSAAYRPPFVMHHQLYSENCRLEGSGDSKFVQCGYDLKGRFYKHGDFIDVNGDGLLDWVQSFRTSAGLSSFTWLNTGKGWAAGPAAPFAAYDYNQPAGRDRIGDYADVNGDGLRDFVAAAQWSTWTERATWLSTGNGWRRDAAYDAPGILYRYDHPSWNGKVSEFGDLDGNGTPDLVHAYRSSSGAIGKATYIDREAAPDLIVGITDSLGALTTLTYKPMTDTALHTKGTAAFPEVALPQPAFFVSRVDRDDGVGGLASTAYSYEGAKFDTRGRGFLGFRLMHAQDLRTNVTTSSQYRQDFPFIGQVEITDTYLADGTTVKTLTNTWGSLSLNAGATVFPYVPRSVAESYEINHGPGNLPVTTATTSSTYDTFGNPTEIVVATTAGLDTFTKTTTNTYVNDTVKWHLGRLTRAEVKSDLPDLRTATRVSAFAYDPVTGLLTREVIEPDLPAFTLTTDHGYDLFGNETSVTVSGADIATRTSTTTYTADGRFPEVATNALGHSETRVHDPRFGAVTSLTGPNGITTTWDYDAFGREVRESRADGTRTETFYELCTIQCPSGGVYLVRQQDSIAATGAVYDAIDIQYFDQLNRAFRGETEGFDGSLVYADTVFNALGQVEKVSRPYFAGTAAAEIQWATTAYDVIGRTLSVTQPNGCTVTNSYDGLTITATNCKSQTETKTNDAIGQLARVVDDAGTTVTYTYDPFGNLEATDAGGVVTSMTYDIRGRKTSMDDPDMGFWTYEYNVLGELVRQIAPATGGGGGGGTPGGDAVTGFVLVNAETGQDISPINNGDLFYLSSLPTLNLAIRADTQPATVGSVRFDFNGTANFRTDDAAPYALFGKDSSGGYIAWDPTSDGLRAGQHSITATPYSGAGGTGAAGASLAVSFEIVAHTDTVMDFVLVNADTDQDIAPLNDGDVLNLAALPTANLNIRVEPRSGIQPGIVSGVLHFVDGLLAGADTDPPFAVFGKAGGDYFPWQFVFLALDLPVLGAHTVASLPTFDSVYGFGIPGIVSFEVIYDPFAPAIASGTTAQSSTTMLAATTAAAAVAANEVTMAYDLLGRMVSRTETEGTTTWTYDTALKGIGKLAGVSRTEDDYAEAHTYDSLGRAASTTVTYETASYVSSQTYDAAGRVHTITYPSGFAVEQVYNAFGYLEEVREWGGAGTSYWRAVAVNAEGQVTEEQLGNGLVTLRDFDPRTGLVTGIGTWKGPTVIQDMAFQFDLLGNLEWREDRRQNRRESFGYDTLNRLTSATLIDTVLDPQGLAPLAVTDYAYDAIGNLTFKSDVGTYTYGGPGGGPHAVTAVAGTVNKTYAYDERGRMTTTAAAGGALLRSVSWSSFDKPVNVQAHDSLSASDFVYGPDRARIKQTIYSGAAPTKTITYLGAYEVHAVGALPDEQVHYIRAGGTVAIYTRVDDADPATDKTRWLHKDHLGSIALLTDEAGVIAEERSFDPHGRARNADWTAASGAVLLGETKRGFTGHEHIDTVGLIHMNGRVYDPEIGRFLSADPFVQFPETTQGFNRYSYVNNNPLSATDPSGFFLKGLFEAIGNAIGDFGDWIMSSTIGNILGYVAIAVLSLACGPAAGACFILGSMLFSGAVTAYNGGNFRQVATGSIMAGMTAMTGAYIGSIAGPLMEAGLSQVGAVAVQVAASGAVGAGYSALWGGDPAVAALTGAAGAFFGAGVEGIDIAGSAGAVARTVAAAVASGAVAELGGGKFVNGAISGAFFRLIREAENAFGGGEPAETEGERSRAHDVQLASRSSGSLPLRQLHRDSQGRWREGSEPGNKSPPFDEPQTRPKSINLPSWKKVKIDMDHIASGHMVGGSRVSSRKTVFPENMPRSAVERTVRQAYRYGSRLRMQDVQVLVQGRAYGFTVRMWVNTSTKEITSAWPVY